jgi:hypothetical protein
VPPFSGMSRPIRRSEAHFVASLNAARQIHWGACLPSPRMSSICSDQCARLQISAQLKPISQRQLHETRRHRTDGLAKAPAGDIALDGSGAEKLRMIGQIECLDTKLKGPVIA